MSNALAIAAVTAVLKDLLDNALVDHSVSSTLSGNVEVTAVAPDRINLDTLAGPRLNLYLYRVTPNQGWRNAALPSQSVDGRRLSNPPLALNLHYMLTAYASNDFEAEILLGYGMQLLHEVPVLTREAIRTTLATPSPVDGAILPPPLNSLAASALADQVELVKITPDLMTTEEISKLWAAFQATYRPTAAYRASVVLIESRAAVAAPLPVQTRSIFVQPSLEGAATPIVQPDEVPGLQLWLRSDTGVTYDGQGVSLWSDQSGNDNHARQSDAARRPAFVGHTLGITPALRFDGVDDYLAIENLQYNAAGAIPEITVCALVRSSSTNPQIIAGFDADQFWQLALKDDVNVNAGWDTTDAADTRHNLRSVAAYTDGNWHLLCGWFSRTATPDKLLFVDGDQVAPDPGAPPPPFHDGEALGTVSVADPARFGFLGVGSEADTFDGGRGPDFFFAGDLIEVLVYHHALSEVERRALERYLIDRYRP